MELATSGIRRPKRRDVLHTILFYSLQEYQVFTLYRFRASSCVRRQLRWCLTLQNELSTSEATTVAVAESNTNDADDGRKRMFEIVTI